MAPEYDLSRTTIYDIAKRVSILFEPRLPGPVPCLKRMLPCGTTPSQPATEAKTLSREKEKQIRGPFSGLSPLARDPALEVKLPPSDLKSKPAAVVPQSACSAVHLGTSSRGEIKASGASGSGSGLPSSGNAGPECVRKSAPDPGRTGSPVPLGP